MVKVCWSPWMCVDIMAARCHSSVLWFRFSSPIPFTHRLPPISGKGQQWPLSRICFNRPEVCNRSKMSMFQVWSNSHVNDRVMKETSVRFQHQLGPDGLQVSRWYGLLTQPSVGKLECHHHKHRYVLLQQTSLCFPFCCNGSYLLSKSRRC